jgi:hypothetical protein
MGARFGPGVEHGPRASFSLNADLRDDAVQVTVPAHQDGIAFSDSSLGAELFGYRDGQWRVAGNRGPSLPAERVLWRGDTVRPPLTVSQHAQRYRPVVRVVGKDHSDLGVARVEVARK